MSTTQPLRVSPSVPSDREHIGDVLLTSGIFGATDADCVDEMFTGTWQALAANPNADTYHWLSCRMDYAENADLLGFACVGTESLTHGTWDLFWVCVRPQARGMGVGSALLQAAIQKAQQHAARLMVIYTSSTPAYAPARALYESQAFAPVAVVKDYYNDGDDLMIYTKKINK